MADMRKLVTLGKCGRATIVEKKSEFIGYASPVGNEEEAIDFINGVRKRHSDARHNVYAYAVGNTTRYSDDGEPQGTAGIPVLDVIKKSGFTNAVIVVTRYFGGILLGAGGLVRAYTKAAKEACDDAGIVTYKGYTELAFSFDYSLYDRIRNRLAFLHAKTDKCDFAHEVTMQAALPDADAEGFVSFLSEISAGRVKCNVIGNRFDHE